MSLKKNVCLNMIVKNESKVIRRCLNSVKHLIDYWVIVDTGSTDGTQALIKEILKDIPGELFERPWKNFEHNRNEALELAYPKSRTLLFIDADEELKASKSFSVGSLDRDIYLINVQLPNGTIFQRQFMIGTKIKWFWRGVVHEQVYTDVKSTTHRILGDAYIFANDDGGRTGKDSRVKFLNDAKVLEEALITEPRNSRYVFYLANSYSNARELQLALKQYEKRALMGGWDQEVFYSLYSIGRIQKELEMDPKIFIKSFIKAYRYRPTRAEPLFWIANHYMDIRDFESAYDILKDAIAIPLPTDAMMVERTMYDYVLPWMFADCTYSLQRFGEAIAIYEKLLTNRNLPKDIRQIVLQNLSNVKKGVSRPFPDKPSQGSLF